MSYKNKLLYNYLVNIGIGFVVIGVIICCVAEIIADYPNPLTVNINTTDPYLSMFFACCLGYGFIEITGRLIASVTFCLITIINYLYEKACFYFRTTNDCN